MNAITHLHDAVPDRRAHNLAVVDQHMRIEAIDPDSVMALYTEDAVLDIPARGLHFDTLDAIRDNYIRMFASMAEVQIQPMDRFATEDRVVNECMVTLRISGDGVTGAPVAIGARARLRLLHVFHMRDRRIAREDVFEAWRQLAG